MKITVYKGFSKNFLNQIQSKSLSQYKVDDKVNPLIFDDNYKQSLLMNLISLSEDKWMTYEEFSLLCNDDNGTTLQNLVKTFNNSIEIVINNSYPELYLNESIEYNLLTNLEKNLESDIQILDKDMEKILKVYNEIVSINGVFYHRYLNTEYDMDCDIISINKYYNDKEPIIMKDLHSDFIFEIGEDEKDYIEKISILEQGNFNNIGIKRMGQSERDREIFKNFCAYLNMHAKYQISDYFQYGERKDLEKEFLDIAIKDIKIPGFNSFKMLSFYKNPDLSNEIEKISQSQIMSDMVLQFENAMKCEQIAGKTSGKQLSGYRDIFVTAPTGAGKSVIFQIPAVYLAKKYGALTIIITPLIELMNDQVRNLHERGYKQAERINSSINPMEKKIIVDKINNGEINLLYLAPETLLSYSIDQLIGTRRIGLMIVDEAHIVSTWGKGFRPDYWYLGSYFDSLRKFKNYLGLNDEAKKIYCFPICTFTATAVNGGEIDDVNDIKSSLNLKDTITYIGKVKRNDIYFEIVNCDRLEIKNKDLYFEDKINRMTQRIKKWTEFNEKTIIYFPYKTTANDAYRASAANGFGNLSEYKHNISIYTGGNNFTSEEKSNNMLEFRSGEKKIMLATKAFGMGIDINDINNVYHFAASGNLNDYIQEIGRVARSKEIDKGYAIVDYYKRDLNYMKALYGMSALNNYQVIKILNIIYNVHKTKGKYSILVTPEMFASVFQKCDSEELEVKVKTALLTIEKDLCLRYRGSRPIVTRPRSMFTQCYAMIYSKKEKEILNSFLGEFVQRISKARDHEVDMESSFNPCYTTDMGDIYLIDLKELWEKKFSKIKFSEFKHRLYSTPEEIFGKFSDYINIRYKLSIKMLDESMLSTLKDKLFTEIDIVSNVLNEYQISGEYFSKKDFAEKLKVRYSNSFKAQIVANSYIEMLADYKDEFAQSFYERREVNDNEKFRILRGNFRSIAEKIVNTSSMIRKFNYGCKTSVYETYKPYTKAKDRDNSIDVLNLALLFGLISFEIIGGNKPEIYIRINKPDKIRQIINGDFLYSNSLVNKAKIKHKSDVEILNFFFTGLNGDVERWNFIEDYYLGKIEKYREKIKSVD